MNRLILAAPILILSACGGGEPDNTREVERPARTHDYVPVQAVDKAVRVEADTAMATIHRQIQLTAATESNRRALYAELEGPLNDAKLARLGMSAATLAGTNYRASDYHLSFQGNQLTITAGQPGTRGYKQATYSLR